MSRLVEICLLLVSFVVVTLIAEAAGAVDLGTSLTFGTIAFTLTLLAILLKRP